MLAEADTTEDAVLGGRLVLRQPKRGHRFGHDAILLAAAVDARPGEIAVESAPASGPRGSRSRTACRILRCGWSRSIRRSPISRARTPPATGFPIAYRSPRWMSRRNRSAFERHGMVGVDHVLMNPPFNDPANVSPDAARRRAHVAGAGALATWVDCAAALLAARGTLTLIWRATGLSDVLGALGGTFGGIAILPIHPKPSAAAIRILVRAVKGSARAARPAPAAHAQRRGWKTERRGGSGPARRRVAADDGLSRRR